MSLDIRPDHLKIVEEILKKHLPDREVWAFGSRVNGTAKETSDLDLVVIGENSLDFQTLGALRDYFSESNLPYKVDLVDWAKIGETFREIIRKDKIRINNRNLTNTHGGRGHNRIFNNLFRTLGALKYRKIPYNHNSPICHLEWHICYLRLHVAPTDPTPHDSGRISENFNFRMSCYSFFNLLFNLI